MPKPRTHEMMKDGIDDPSFGHTCNADLGLWATKAYRPAPEKNIRGVSSLSKWLYVPGSRNLLT
jgi:hypothetical protein